MIGNLLRNIYERSKRKVASFVSEEINETSKYFIDSNFINYNCLYCDFVRFEGETSVLLVQLKPLFASIFHKVDLVLT